MTELVREQLVVHERLAQAHHRGQSRGDRGSCPGEGHDAHGGDGRVFPTIKRIGSVSTTTCTPGAPPGATSATSSDGTVAEAKSTCDPSMRGSHASQMSPRISTTVRPGRRSF